MKHGKYHPAHQSCSDLNPCTAKVVHLDHACCLQVKVMAIQQMAHSYRVRVYHKMRGRATQDLNSSQRGFRSAG